MKTKTSTRNIALITLSILGFSLLIVNYLGFSDSKTKQEEKEYAEEIPDEEVPVNEEPDYEVPFFEYLSDDIDYYGPLDRFWRHSAETKTLVLGGKDYYTAIETCLNNKIDPDEWAQIRQPQQLDRNIGDRFIDEEGKREVFLVEVEYAMSPIHAKAVKALNQCVKQNVSILYEERPMYQVYEVDESADQSVKDEMGGNNPTSLNSIIGIFLPEVVRELYKTLEFAYEAAGWQALVVRDFLTNKLRSTPAFAPLEYTGMRACEYLTYEGFNNLMEHQDGYATSVVLNVFLSEGTDYEGGTFYIKDNVDGKVQKVRPEQYSALAFLGGTYSHGVETILSGTREALSTEFWYYPDLPAGTNLCAAEFVNIERHVKHCNEVQKNPETGEADYSILCDHPFPSYSVYGLCKSHIGDVRNIYDDGDSEGAKNDSEL